MGPVTLRRVAMGLCVAIAVADLVQVLLQLKGIGAVGGLVIYATCARGLQQHHRWAPVILLLMPIFPFSVFLGLRGEEVRATLVDGPMIAIAVLQVLASGCGAGMLWSGWANRETTR